MALTCTVVGVMHLPDLSGGFDTINQSILLDHFSDVAIGWEASFYGGYNTFLKEIPGVAGEDY